jgi:hypothetical protein
LGKLFSLGGDKARIKGNLEKNSNVVMAEDRETDAISL